MKLLVNAAQMKAADQYTIQELGIASLELMERAANACVQTIQSENLDLSSVCVVCGSGNNGGDGFAIARILKNMGVLWILIWSAIQSIVHRRHGNR